MDLRRPSSPSSVPCDDDKDDHRRYNVWTGPQIENRISCVMYQKRVTAFVFQALRKRKMVLYAENRFSKAPRLAIIAERYIEEKDDDRNHVVLSNEMFHIHFSFNFNRFVEL